MHANTGIKDEFLNAIGNSLTMHLCVVFSQRTPHLTPMPFDSAPLLLSFIPPFSRVCTISVAVRSIILGICLVWSGLVCCGFNNNVRCSLATDCVYACVCVLCTNTPEQCKVNNCFVLSSPQIKSLSIEYNRDLIH